MKHRWQGAQRRPGTRRGLGRRQGRHGIAQAPVGRQSTERADAKMAGKIEAATARDIAKAHAGGDGRVAGHDRA